jgi:hypothetical protein
LDANAKAHRDPQDRCAEIIAMLDFGMTVPRIQQDLRSQGIPADEITALLERALTERARRLLAAEEKKDRYLHINRVSSAVVAAILFLVFVLQGNPKVVLRGVMIISISLAGIWFGDGFGTYFRPKPLASLEGYPMSGTPIQVAGWLFLIIASAVLLLQAHITSMVIAPHP